MSSEKYLLDERGQSIERNKRNKCKQTLQQVVIESPSKRVKASIPTKVLSRKLSIVGAPYESENETKDNQSNEHIRRPLSSLLNETCIYFTGTYGSADLAILPEEATKQLLIVLISHPSCCFGTECKFGLCKTSFLMSRHVASCQDRFCNTTGCWSSRVLIAHYNACQGSCKICVPQRMVELKTAFLRDKVYRHSDSTAESATSLASNIPPLLLSLKRKKKSYMVAENSKDYPFDPFGSK
jgi:hypothetical protein